MESSICKGKTPNDPLRPKLNKLTIKIVAMTPEVIEISLGNTITELYIFHTILTIRNTISRKAAAMRITG